MQQIFMREYPLKAEKKLEGMVAEYLQLSNSRDITQVKNT